MKNPVNLQVYKSFAARVLLLSPNERPVVVRVVRLSRVPYQRVRAGDRFTVELQVVRELGPRRRARG
jgi:hypothetical protein